MIFFIALIYSLDFDLMIIRKLIPRISIYSSLVYITITKCQLLLSRNYFFKEKTLSVINESLLSSPYAKPILKFLRCLSQFSIKEITQFRHLKLSCRSVIKKIMIRALAVTNSIAFSPDDKIIISGGDDAVLRIWDSDQLRLIKILSFNQSTTTAIDISHNSNYVLAGSGDGSISLWNLKYYRLECQFKAHSHLIRTLNFIKKSQLCLSSSFDGIINLFNLKKKILLRKYNLKSPVFITLITSNIKTVLVGCENKLFFRFDLITRKKIYQLQLNSYAHSCVILPKTNNLLIGHLDGTISLVEFQYFKILKNFWAHTNTVGFIRLHPKNKLFVSSSVDQYIKVWKVATWEFSHLFNVSHFPIVSINFRKNGILYICSNDGKIRTFEIETCKKTETHVQNYIEICISVSLNMIAFGHDFLKLYELTSGSYLSGATFLGFIYSLQFVKSIIIMATSKGQILYFKAPNLTILRKFYMTRFELKYVRSSNDFKQLAYLYGDKY